jgi:hypothetical protein
MWTERHEEVPRQLLQPYWPEKSTKRRIFDRPAENQPYIEFLRTQKFDSENDEADASSDDDNDNVSSNHEEEYRSDKNDAERMSDVRLFMKGMTGDENRLNYRDQVDQVASFCERASSSKPKTNNGKGGKSVALLDEKRIGSTIAGKNEHCTPYSERLTSQELLEYLSRKVTPISCCQQGSKETHNLNSVSEPIQQKAPLLIR